jgi:uncharacterized protein YciI
MLFAVHCLDRPDAGEERRLRFDEHMAYVKSRSAMIVLSGPLLADDLETTIGSMFIVEAEDKQAALAFNSDDPFARTGIWKEVRVHPFRKRIDNRT